MYTFFILLGAAVIAYRVLVKGESLVVKNPDWKKRGLAGLAMGLSTIALAVYSLIASYLHQVPILGAQWLLLAAGVFFAAVSVRMMKRPSSPAPGL
jgi:hypothetical protein